MNKAGLTSPAKRRRGEPVPPRLVKIRVDPLSRGIDQLDGGVRYSRAGTRIVCRVMTDARRGTKKKTGVRFEVWVNFCHQRKEKEKRQTAGREDLEGYTKTRCDTLDLLIRIHLRGQGHPIKDQLVLLTTSAVRRLIARHL